MQMELKTPESGYLLPDELSQDWFSVLRARLLVGSFWNLVATLANQASVLIANVIVARLLGQQVYGEFAMVQQTLVSMAALVQLSMGYTATKYVAEFRSVDRLRTERILGLCLVVVVLMASLGTIIWIIVSPWLAVNVLRAPHLTLALVLGAGYMFFSSLNGYQIGVLVGLESYPSLAKAGILGSIVVILGVLLGVLLMGMNGAVLALVGTAAFRCLIYNVWLQSELRKHSLRPRFDGLMKEKDIVLRFSLPAALSSYYSLPAIWLASSFLIREKNGAEQFALYGAATNIRLLVLFVPIVINNVGLSVLNNEKGQGDISRYNRVFRLNLGLIVASVIFAGCLVALLGKPMLHIFGKGFGAGEYVLWILLASTLTEGLTIGLHQHIQSHAKLWGSFFGVNLPRETSFVILAFVLVPLYGAVGLSLAYLSATMVGLVGVIAVYRRIRNEAEEL